jgi:hypothetical protein
MAEQSRSKRSHGDFRFRLRCTDHRRCQFVGERQILELIYLAAPLPGILNKLCMMIDVRIGDVVSTVSLPDEAENHFCSMTDSTLQLGLESFSSSAILSPDRVFLGMLEIFGCDLRRPTIPENNLINRVPYLAALALQRPDPEDRVDRPAMKPKGRLIGPLEKPKFIN